MVVIPVLRPCSDKYLDPGFLYWRLRNGTCTSEREEKVSSDEGFEVKMENLWSDMLWGTVLNGSGSWRCKQGRVKQLPQRTEALTFEYCKGEYLITLSVQSTPAEKT